MDSTLSADISQAASPSGGLPIFLISLISALLVPVIMFTVITQILHGVSPLISYLVTIAASLIFLALGLWSLRRSGIPLAAIGLTPAKGVEALWMALLVWVLYGLLLLPLVIAQHASLAELFQSSPAQILQQWLFVGVAEEILFRGYFLTWLRRRFARLGHLRAVSLAMLVSSLIFALYHIPQRLYQVWQGKMGIYAAGSSLLLLVLMGLLFAYVYIRTGNILFAALVHGSSNCRLIGSPNDLMPLIVLFLVIEAVGFIRSRRRDQSLVKT